MPAQAHTSPPKPSPTTIQTALQAAASRSDTSCARRCNTNRSKASIATTKARKAAHAHSGTVTARHRPSAAAEWSAFAVLRWSRFRQQPRFAEHVAGALDGALARDQVVAGRDQLAHGAEVALAPGPGVRHISEDGAPHHAKRGAGRGDRE